MEWVAPIKDALAAEPRARLWDEAPGIATAEQSTNLAKLKAAPFVKRYRTYLEEAGATVSVGHNQGSGDVSFTLVFGESPAAAATLRGNILLAALGFHPAQQSGISANACIDAFHSDTQIAIIQRRFKPPGTIVIIVKPLADCWEPARSTFSTKSAKHKQLRYSPAHLTLDEGRNTDAVVSTMVSDFWSGVRDGNYVPSEALQGALTPMLHRFLSAGVRGVTNSFCVEGADNGLKLYLLGKPGAGKSAFVSSLAANLEAVLRAHLDTSQSVSIVKVPLNAMTPQALQQQALVKGLSDHSIERVIEQDLKEGRIVLLHLEENPEAHAHQALLDATIRGMLAKLSARYPAFRHHVVVVNTSNHELAPELVGSYGPTVHLTPPGPADRRAWVARRIRDISGVPGCELRDIPEEEDMRLLNLFCLTVAYAVRRLASSPDASVAVERGSGAAEGHTAWRILQEGVPPVALRCSPSLFCHEVNESDPGEGAEADEADEAASLRTVIAMSRDGVLSPALVVIRGGGAGDPPALLRAQAACDELLGSEKVQHTSLSVLRQEDAPLVFGDPKQIRGGLFKTIDDCTSPNSPAYFKHVVVSAVVNEEGQFLLRELLEQGDKSRTHRLGVSKAGCIFLLVTAEEDTRITPQVQSRTHLIL